MEWQIIIAMVIAVPVILLPAAFVWYLNIGGFIKLLKEKRAKTVKVDKKVSSKV